MAHYGFERPTSFAEGFLPSKHAKPLPWPVGVQEEYDVTWHVHDDAVRDDARTRQDERGEGAIEELTGALGATAPRRLEPVTGRASWLRRKPDRP